MWSKSEGWVGISPTHLAMATVFRGSHQEVKEELFVPWNLKGNGVSQNEQPQNEILRSEGAWGRCPQQAACGEMDSHKHCLPQYATHKIKKLTTGRLLPPIVSFLCLSDL